jgi:adenylate kinase family enzyme
VLRADDRLPARPQRVLVAGASGAGKTTLAGAIGRVLGIPHVEIDALFHGPGWTPRPEFEADVVAFGSGPSWVTEWQYDVVRPVLLDRADLLVWLDLSRTRVLRQVTRRTVRRRLQRVELWNGNLEPPLRTFFTDPEHIVRWAWTTHGRTGPRVAQARRKRPELTVVRLRSRSDVRRWLDGPLAAVAEQRPGGGAGDA